MQKRAEEIPIVMLSNSVAMQQLFRENIAEIENLFEGIKKEIRDKNESYRRIAEESGKLQKINFEINMIEEKAKWLTYIREKMNAILEI